MGFEIFGGDFNMKFWKWGRGLQVSIDVRGNLGISTLLSIWHYYKCGEGGYIFSITLGKGYIWFS
jgi:hypothetical protein